MRAHSLFIRAHIAKSSGFTLIELIVALSIVAILSAVGSPMFSELIANQRTKSVANDLYTSLMKARSEAVKRNANITMAPTSGSGWVGGWQILDANSAIIHSYNAPKGVTITGGPTSIVYQNAGRIQGNTAPSFLVTSSASSSIQKCVTTDLNGRPHLKASAC